MGFGCNNRDDYSYNSGRCSGVTLGRMIARYSSHLTAFFDGKGARIPYYTPQLKYELFPFSSIEHSPSSTRAGGQKLSTVGFYVPFSKTKCISTHRAKASVAPFILRITWMKPASLISLIHVVPVRANLLPPAPDSTHHNTWPGASSCGTCSCCRDPVPH